MPKRWSWCVEDGENQYQLATSMHAAWDVQSKQNAHVAGRQVAAAAAAYQVWSGYRDPIIATCISAALLMDYTWPTMHSLIMNVGAYRAASTGRTLPGTHVILQPFCCDIQATGNTKGCCSCYDDPTYDMY
jgi:hypothetical protein